MDIISLLSDDLLLRVLSFFPTKDVVDTSLLSKRWRFLWRLVTNLEYNDTDYVGDYKSFSHFVYRSLLSNKAPVLEDLYLKLIDKHETGLCGKETPIGWKTPSCVPECLLFSLEAFEWTGYKGRQGDREISTYVLKNAACLKKATFSPESTDVAKKYQMLKDLTSIPTASIRLNHNNNSNTF